MHRALECAQLLPSDCRYFSELGVCLPRVLSTVLGSTILIVVYKDTTLKGF